MNEGKISTRYAKALIGLAIEKKTLNVVINDVQLVYSFCKNADFKAFLMNPVIQKSDKQIIFHSIFKNKVNPITTSFLDLVLKNNRESYLSLIARKFIDYYKEYNGIKSAILTSVKPLNDSQKQKLVNSMKQLFKSEIEMEEVIDESIMGGFVLTVEDQQFDASVVSKLKYIKQELISSSFDN